MVRRSWETEARKRFGKLKRLVRDAILDKDALALATDSLTSSIFMRAYGSDAIRMKDALPTTREFDFPRSATKINAFMQWLLENSSSTILGVSYGTSIEAATDASWQNVYIKTAYQKGVKDAAGNMKSAGVSVSNNWVTSAFNRDIHAERVALAYTRAYEALDNVTAVMADQMREVLAEGIASGLGPDAMARTLVDRIDAIGATRASTIARTETIAAHAAASLSSYREAGILGVEVLAEFTTADDDDVCPECENLQGRQIPIAEADGIIPVHPNCRCAFIPIVNNPDEVSLV